MSLTFYEFAPTRSARVRWTLLELGVPFDSRSGFDLIGSDELRRVHPLARLPAIVDDGRPLFESAAICNWLADSHPERNLIARPGTWQRAQHDQWVAFTLAELEAYLWSMARNGFALPEDQRVREIMPQNVREAGRALAVLDDHLADRTFIVDDRFTVADIFVGYAVNWARLAGLTGERDHVQAFNERLLAMPHCPFPREIPK